MREAMLEWFKGDEAAVSFAVALWEFAQTWDDVIDEGDTSQANVAMSWIAFRCPYDPFFAQYGHLLRPAMLLSYLNWRDANVLETGDRDDLVKAFMLRASIYDVFALMAWIIGGEAHSQAVGPAIRRMYGETLDDYLKEHGHA